MRNKGIRLMLETAMPRFEQAVDGSLASTTKGETVEADQMMLAIGRMPNTVGLGLEAAGVVTRPAGQIEGGPLFAQLGVAHLCHRRRHRAPGIDAGRDPRSHVLCETVFGGKPSAPDHELVATAVFTRPEIGTVGLTEEKALQRPATHRHLQDEFPPLKNTLSGREERP